MKNANLPILLVVIAAVAITAQLTRQTGEKPEWKSLRQDMSSCLTSLWQQPGHQVELLPAGEGVSARVAVAMPPGLRLRQQRWNYPFLRFVAARHPGVSLQNLSVVESGSDRPVPEVAMAGLLADRAFPISNFEDEEERLCQMTARQIAIAVQHKLGAGHELVLVDAQLARSIREDRIYGSPEGGQLARRASGAVAQPLSNRVMVTEIRVVVDQEVSPAEWEKFQAENPMGGANFRVVTLPKP